MESAWATGHKQRIIGHGFLSPFEVMRGKPTYAQPQSRVPYFLSLSVGARVPNSAQSGKDHFLGHPGSEV